MQQLTQLFHHLLTYVLTLSRCLPDIVPDNFLTLIRLTLVIPQIRLDGPEEGRMDLYSIQSLILIEIIPGPILDP